MGEVVNGPGGYFGSNLDAFRDCLCGDFGTPDGGYVIRWLNSAVSRRNLGYPETARQHYLTLQTCHPLSRDYVRENIERALRHEGPTVFDQLVEIIREAHGVTLELR